MYLLHSFDGSNNDIYAAWNWNWLYAQFEENKILTIEGDPTCIAALKNYVIEMLDDTQKIQCSSKRVKARLFVSGVEEWDFRCSPVSIYETIRDLFRCTKSLFPFNGEVSPDVVRLLAIIRMSQKNPRQIKCFEKAVDKMNSEFRTLGTPISAETVRCVTKVWNQVFEAVKMGDTSFGSLVSVYRLIKSCRFHELDFPYASSTEWTEEEKETILHILDNTICGDNIEFWSVQTMSKSSISVGSVEIKGSCDYETETSLWSVCCKPDLNLADFVIAALQSYVWNQNFMNEAEQKKISLVHFATGTCWEMEIDDVSSNIVRELLSLLNQNG